MTTQEQNFQPQVRDTRNGPHLHTYILRSDGSIMVGGVAYVPQNAPGIIAATTLPAVVQPAMIQPVVQPTVYPIVTPIPTQVPLVVQQPYLTPPQPAAYGYPYGAAQPYMYNPAPGGMPNNFSTYHIQQPAFGTFSLTANDVLHQQLATAQGLEMNKKQEMKPADDDKFRMYWVRELDGTWTQRNRLTIDSGDIGSVRWYALDGAFYAVRLPD